MDQPRRPGSAECPLAVTEPCPSPARSTLRSARKVERRRSAPVSPNPTMTKFLTSGHRDNASARRRDRSHMGRSRSPTRPAPALARPSQSLARRSRTRRCNMSSSVRQSCASVAVDAYRRVSTLPADLPPRAQTGENCATIHSSSAAVVSVHDASVLAFRPAPADEARLRSTNRGSRRRRQSRVQSSASMGSVPME